MIRLINEYAKNASVVRARAIFGKRLKAENYSDLVTKKTVNEAAEYLKKNTHFGETLSNVDTAGIHRGHLESMLRRAYFDRYVKLCQFENIGREPFYNYLLIRFEIDELLKAILYLNSRHDDDYIESMNTYFIKQARFDMIALARSRSFEDMLKVIRHTPYYDTLKKIRPEEDGTVNYTKCEVKLETYYTKWLLTTVKKNFSGRSEEALKKLINVQTDLTNIMNVYRMKKFFGADPETIQEYILPFKGRISKYRQSELFEAPTPEDFIRLLSDTIYGKQMGNLDENMDSEQFERDLIRLRCNLAKRSLMFSENAAVSLYSLMYLSEVEVNNVIYIIEGIRYKKSPKYIENLIVVH